MKDNKNSIRIISSILGVMLVVITAVYSAPPKVVCVPSYAPNPAIPHDTWSGKEVTLKGTAKDPDGDALVSYEWNFGDGSVPVSGSVSDPYVIEVKHTYSGSIDDKFVATLTVTDAGGESGTDSYLIEVKDGSDIKVKVNVAIDEGLWYLHKTQIRGTYADGAEYGYWNHGGYPNQHPASNTGAATEAFEIQGSLPTGDENENPYVETVQRGLNYLLGNMHVHTISSQLYGNPDANGNGVGLGSYTDGGRTMYECGITLMTFASSLDSNRIAETGNATWVKGRRYKDIVQDMVDYLAWGQNESGAARGGWRYAGNYSTSDNSCSQWPVIGMEAAERNFGIVIPTFVRDELLIWLNASRNSDGGFKYSNCCYGTWQCSNVARTGAGIAMLSFCNIPVTDSRIQNALNYLNAHWTDNHGCMGTWDYHFSGGGNYYAFYGVMKGMRVPEPDIEMIGPRDWYEDYANFITADQESNGRWIAHSNYHDPYLGTAWALLTLYKTVVEPGPVADAGSDIPNHPPLIEVTLDASGSYHLDPGKEIVQYCWDFDASDGIDWNNPDMCTGSTVVKHAFPAVYDGAGDIDWGATAKNYTVTLRVQDNSDPYKYSTDEAIVHITPPPWPPVADPNGPYTAGKCETITLDGSESYDPNGELYPDPTHPWHGEIISWDWDLDNDGEYDDASGQTVSWVSCDKGIYVVGLQVTNNFSEADATDVVISVVNRWPIADANGPYFCSGGEVVFDGSGSYDPDPGETESLVYRWDFDNDGNFDTDWLLDPTATHTYEVCQEYTVVLVVKDIDDATGIDSAHVIPNSPPVADAGDDRTIEQATLAGTEVPLDGSGSYDLDNNIVSYEWYEGEVLLGSGEIIQYTFQLGTHAVTLVVTDAYGETDEDEVVIIVTDETPPTIGSLTASPDVLWAPNHKMVEVTIGAVTSDICDADPVSRIISVTSNEPVNDIGDGNTEPDWEITGDLTVDLRAERAGPLTSRIYTITVECTDFSGNTTTSTVTVTVPHDQGKGNQ
jgi:hypothetical protein